METNDEELEYYSGGWPGGWEGAGGLSAESV